jgi:hypothetical protein
MGNRKHGVIDGLAPDLKETVEEMLLAGSTYTDIVDYLIQNDVSISIASICRYAKSYNASVAMLNVAQENFRRMMDELDKYPDLDTTEAMMRLASQNVFNAIANTDEEEWAKIDKDKLLSQALGLLRAAAYKKKVDISDKSDMDAGLEAVKNLVWDAMAQEDPALYKQVASYLKTKKGQGVIKPDKKSKAT